MPGPVYKSKKWRKRNPGDVEKAIKTSPGFADRAQGVYESGSPEAKAVQSVISSGRSYIPSDISSPEREPNLMEAALSSLGIDTGDGSKLDTAMSILDQAPNKIGEVGREAVDKVDDARHMGSAVQLFDRGNYRGALSELRDNDLETPKPIERSINRQLKEAQNRVDRFSGGGAPSKVPDEYKAAIAKWGAWLEKQPGMKSPNDEMKDGLIPASMSGAEYLAKIMQHESGWNHDTYHPRASATGMAQFIPSTRQSMIDNHGVDAWASGNDAIHAAAILLSEGTLGLEGYNPGYPTSGDNQGDYGTWSGYLTEDVGQSSPNQPQKLNRAENLLEAAQRRASNFNVDNGDQKQVEGQGGGNVPWIERPRVLNRLSNMDLMGSQRVVQRLIGSRVHSDKEPGHTAGGYHDPAVGDAYAQDIQLGAANPSENEPVYDQALLDAISRRYARLTGEENPNLQMGQGYTNLPFGPFQLEIIPDSESNFHGTGPHAHIGAKFLGEGERPISSGGSGGDGSGYSPDPTTSSGNSSSSLSGLTDDTLTPTSGDQQDRLADVYDILDMAPITVGSYAPQVQEELSISDLSVEELLDLINRQGRSM